MPRYKSKCSRKSLDSCKKIRKCKLATGSMRGTYCRSLKNRLRYKSRMKTLRNRTIMI